MILRLKTCQIRILKLNKNDPLGSFLFRRVTLGLNEISWQGMMNKTNVESNKATIEKAYDSDPWWYDVRGFLILTFSYRSTLWGQIDFFSRNLKENHLEAAIGSGSLFVIVLQFAKWFRKPPTSIVAFDYAEPMLVGARARFKNEKSMRLFAGDAANLPIESQTMTSINLANAFHCIAQIDQCMREFHRVLKPGGTMAVNVLLRPRGWAPFRRLAEAINRWGIKKGILYRDYLEDEALSIVRSADFEILESRVGGNCLNILAIKR